jgi:hypothetical protein
MKSGDLKAITVLPGVEGSKDKLAENWDMIK